MQHPTDISEDHDHQPARAARERPSGQPGMMRSRGKDRQGRTTWQLRAYAGRNLVTGEDKYAYLTFKGSEKEARKALAALVTDVTRDQLPPPGSRTLGHIWRKLSDLGFPGFSPSFVAGYDKNWRNHVEPVLADLPLKLITPEVLETLYAALADKPCRRGGRKETGGTLSPWTVRHCHTLVCSLLSTAVRWGWLSGPHAGQRCKAPSVPERTKPRAPTAETVCLLLSDLAGEDLVFHRLAAITGDRRGELSALRWNDLDEVGKLLVDEAVKVGYESFVDESGEERRRKVITIGQTKVHAERSSHLDPDTLGLLIALRQEQEARAAVCGTVLGEDAFVFAADVEGRHFIDPDRWSRRWRRHCKRHGVAGVRLHDLRHFVGVNLAPLGLRVVMDALGHSRLSTGGIYQAHDASRVAGQTMAALLG